MQNLSRGSMSLRYKSLTKGISLHHGASLEFLSFPSNSTRLRGDSIQRKFSSLQFIPPYKMSVNLPYSNGIRKLYPIYSENIRCLSWSAIADKILGGDSLKMVQRPSASVSPVSPEPTVPTQELIVSTTDFIAPPPPVLDLSSDSADLVLNALGEPTLRSLGIGSYLLPTGYIQHCLDALHVYGNLSWWASLIIFYFVYRGCIMYFNVKYRKKMAELSIIVPKYISLSKQTVNAASRKDYYDLSRFGVEKSKLIPDGKIFPISSIVAVSVMPLVLSWALFGMVNVPVPSLHTGGFLWFSDFTLSDPYYILPIINGLGFYVNMQLLLEKGGNLPIYASLGKYGLSILTLGVSSFMPSMIQFYWCLGTIASTVLNCVMQRPRFLKWVNIPQRKPSETDDGKPEPGIFDLINQILDENKFAKKMHKRETNSKQASSGTSNLGKLKTYATREEAVNAKKMLSTK
jgi:membrane protein insertase Oxa1/YidC/SpoIIIJ